jgi:capsular polysaccharide biosynthesis protein
VENALIPTSPLSDKNRQMLILSIVAGLLIGIGISFFLEYMDRTIRTDEDVQNHLNLTVLSVIPAANSAKTYGYGETA